MTPPHLVSLVLVYIGMLGACAGSFAGVLISRMPQLRSIVSPRSHCDGCGRTLRLYENIPIVSFVLLRGRCRSCGQGIGARALMLELECAILFVALAVRMPSPYELLVWWVACVLLIALTYIDLDYFWLPDALTATLGGWALVAALLPQRLGIVSALLGLLPAVALGLFAWAYMRAFGKEGLGQGDIKLLGALGLLVGAKQSLALLTLACIQGALLGSLMLWVGRTPKATSVSVPPALAGDDWQPDAHAVPFGPFLALAALEIVLCPELIEAGHVQLVQLASLLAQHLG